MVAENAAASEWQEVEKRNLLNLFKLTIKALIDSSVCNGGRSLNSTHKPLQQFLAVLERILQHALLPARTSPSLTGYSKNFWSGLDKMDRMSNNCTEILQSVRSLPDIKTGVGRGRAWLRFAMMQKRLADYFEMLAANRHQLADVYSPRAMLLDEECMAVMTGNLVAINVIEYNFVPREEDLDNLTVVIDLSPFLKDGNYLERFVPSNDEESVEASAEIASLIEQRNYSEEINKKLRNQLDEAVAKHAESEQARVEKGFACEGLELKLEAMKGERDSLKEKVRSMEEEARRREELVQADIQVERDTIQGMNRSLDELYQETKQRLAQEITLRQEAEAEVELQIGMRQEAEVATKLLENDIHEKQDVLVSLRQQLADIKQLNIQLYAQSQELQTQLDHKNQLVKELESKSFSFNDTLRDLETDVKISEQDKQAAMETARKLGAQIADRDNIISSLETDLTIEREWRTTLQAEKDSLVARIDKLQTIADRVPSLEQRLTEVQAHNDQMSKTIAEYEQSLADMGDKVRQQAETLDVLKEIEDQKGWIDDKLVKNCMSCECAFSATIRKHHCRNCGNVVCHSCSSNKIKLPSGKDPVRVCDACKSKLVQPK